MRATTFAVAAASLLGSVVSQDDNDWGSWPTTPAESEPSSTPEADSGYSWPADSTPVEAASTAAPASTWSEWSSASPVEPTSSSSTTWAAWTSTTGSPVEPTSTTTGTWSEWTTSKPVEPTSTTTSTWSAWTTSTPVDVTSTNSTTWAAWTSTTGSPVEPESSSTTWAAWSSTSEVPSEESSSTWSAWQSASASGSPVEATTNQSPSATYTVPVTSTVYQTLTVYPNSDTTVTATATQSNVYTAVASGQCAMQVGTSYGSPTWKPTPASASASSWSAWSSASVSVSASSASTWAAWSSAAPKNGGGSISANGDKFGMTYSPYTSDGKCKDAGTVYADISKLAGLGFSSVRVYSTDCDTLPNVGGAARQYGLKIILGVFVSETGISGAQPQVDEICKWAQWDIVELIVVGNEVVFQGYATAGDLAGFISSSKGAFKAAGYTGSCTTTDELSVWQQYGSQWCGVVDVVAANLYAFFNPDVSSDMAGDFIQSEINALNKICPDLQSYVMESGWPSAANECNGKACASPEDQAVAIKGIQQTSGSKVVFFSFEDEAWKPDGQWGAEKHFGCASVFES